MIEVRKEMEKGTGFFRAFSVKLKVKNDIVLPVGLIPVWLLYFCSMALGCIQPWISPNVPTENTSISEFARRGVGGPPRAHKTYWRQAVSPVQMAAPTISHTACPGFEAESLLSIYW